jgi:arginine decarboxylase
MNDDDAPLLAAWQRFIQSKPTPFTVPGHKRRAGEFWPTLGDLLHSDVPLYGGLDTIKHAAAAASAAERLGVELWGADWCRYSTGGSTHVNQVAALSVGRPGQRVLVGRTAHRSTLSGLILAGLEPVWLPTHVDARFGLPVGLDLDALDTALDEHTDLAAVFCVEPSYVGTLSDLAEIIRRAHARNVPVVVDQAWAAHFGFAEGYPQHAIQLGADIMITSAHKVLPAYSQAALLVARTERVDAARLERAFDASLTTSPAGSILASVDAGRALLASPTGAGLLGELRDRVEAARVRLRAAGHTVPGPDDFGGRFDPAKLVLLLDRVDGNAVEAQLIEHGMPVEQADRDTLVPIVTMVDDPTTIDRLCAAIEAIPLGEQRERPTGAVWAAPIPPAAMSPRDAFFADHTTVPAGEAVGRISAELIAPYPPGIPVLVPGEVITAETVEALNAAARSGVRIAYAQDPTLHSYVVIE